MSVEYLVGVSMLLRIIRRRRIIFYIFCYKVDMGYCCDREYCRDDCKYCVVFYKVFCKFGVLIGFLLQIVDGILYSDLDRYGYILKFEYRVEDSESFLS